MAGHSNLSTLLDVKPEAGLTYLESKGTHSKLWATRFAGYHLTQL